MSQDKGADGTCETVKVVSPVSDGNPHGYIVINASDFDASTHELYGAEKKDDGKGGKSKKDEGKKEDEKKDDGKGGKSKKDEGKKEDEKKDDGKGGK